MGRDDRWEHVWAEVSPWTGHEGWLEFYVELAPEVNNAGYVHVEDLAMDSAVYVGTWEQLLRDVDEQL